MVKYRRLIQIAVAVFVAVNIDVSAALIRNSLASRIAIPAVQSRLMLSPVAEHHKKESSEAIARATSFPFSELESSLYDEAVLLGPSGPSSGTVSRQDFYMLTTCRLRRRFVQHWDDLPNERLDVARRVFREWLNRAKEKRDADFARLEGQSDSLPGRRKIQGTRIAISTGLFCVARWGSLSETSKLLRELRSYSNTVKDRLALIPDVPEITKQMMPTCVICDPSSQLSILVYAASKDTSLSAQFKMVLSQAIDAYIQGGQLAIRKGVWSDWKASPDWLDALGGVCRLDEVQRSNFDEDLEICELTTSLASEEIIIEKILRLIDDSIR